MTTTAVLSGNTGDDEVQQLTWLINVADELESEELMRRATDRVVQDPPSRQWEADDDEIIKLANQMLNTCGFPERVAERFARDLVDDVFRDLLTQDASEWWQVRGKYEVLRAALPSIPDDIQEEAVEFVMSAPRRSSRNSPR